MSLENYFYTGHLWITRVLRPRVDFNCEIFYIIYPYNLFKLCLGMYAFYSNSFFNLEKLDQENFVGVQPKIRSILKFFPYKKTIKYSSTQLNSKSGNKGYDYFESKG